MALLVVGAVQVAVSAGRATELQGVAVSPAASIATFLASVAALWVASRPVATRRTSRLAAASAVGGALTYPLYLVHTQFGWAVTDRLSSGGIDAWTTLAAARGVSLLLAAGLHLGVERPFGAKLRRAAVAAPGRAGERSGTSAPLPGPEEARATAAPSSTG